MLPAALTVSKNQAHCLLNRVSGDKYTLHLLHFSSHCSYNNEQTLSQDPEDYISRLLQAAQSNGFILPCRVQELCSEKSIRNAHWQAIPIRQQRKEKKKKEAGKETALKSLAVSLYFLENSNALGWFFSRWKSRALCIVRTASRVRPNMWPCAVVQQTWKSASCVILHRKYSEIYWLVSFT